MRRFPFIKQRNSLDCGPTCLQMIAKFYGKNLSFSKLGDREKIPSRGVSILKISEAAKKVGFNTTGAKVDLNYLKEGFKLPCISLWNQKHFIVIYLIKRNTVYVADPSYGKVKYQKEEFLKGFITDDEMGSVLFLYPTQKFYDQEVQK